MLSLRLASILGCVFAFATAASATKHHREHAQKPRNEHQVLDLPGFDGDVSFDHFAGHLELQSKEKIFYWYAESQQNASTDPLVLWLNGGPGCSSVNGMFTENGPFVVQSDLTVKRNHYAWNRKANLVWVESPVGVGFSVPQQPAEYYNDDVVADRTRDFLQQFFAKYPELKHRDFYITGESYAGIYIPYLVELLMDDPIEGVNLKGFAIGNPFTDNMIDGNAYMDYYYTHALISRQAYHRMLKHCSDQIGQCIFTPVNCSTKCQNAVIDGFQHSDAEHFNPYFIYGDLCQVSNTQAMSLYTHKRKQQHATATTHRGDVGPCADTFTHEYLNQHQVQRALHIETTMRWQECNSFIANNYARSLSSLSKYMQILGRGLNVLIYSGDADSVVNFLGTERWITEDGLNLAEQAAWTAWYGPDRQVAGYVQQYQGLTFKTVKGAGHMVPTVRPLHALYMFECFLYGNDTCRKFEYPVDAFMVEAGVGITTQLSDTASADSDDQQDETPADGVLDEASAEQQADQVDLSDSGVLKQHQQWTTTTVVQPQRASWLPVVAVALGGVAIGCVLAVRLLARRRRRATLEERMPFVVMTSNT